jgi:NAD(P)-dependent dehydrogenase (short-subunit alcohol dehydrogenase family)
VEGCVARYGRIDVAFNNAGIGAPRIAPIGDQTLEDFDDVMRTNARGVFTALKYELPRMAANPPRGAFGTRGVVINTASASDAASSITGMDVDVTGGYHAGASLTQAPAR